MSHHVTYGRCCRRAIGRCVRWLARTYRTWSTREWLKRYGSKNSKTAYVTSNTILTATNNITLTPICLPTSMQALCLRSSVNYSIWKVCISTATVSPAPSLCPWLTCLAEPHLQGCFCLTTNSTMPLRHENTFKTRYGLIAMYTCNTCNINNIVTMNIDDSLLSMTIFLLFLVK